MTNKTTPTVQSLDMVRDELIRLNKVEHLSWRKIACLERFYGIPAGTLCAISKSREPRDIEHRRILRLPALELAPVCKKCGEMHVTKRCTNRKQGSRPVQHEHNEQVALFQQISYFENTYPELKRLFAIPNGGHRNKIVGAKLKAEGVKRGVPDLFLPISRGRFHGMFIEMKTGRNIPSPEQREWIDLLKRNGYHAIVEYSAQDAFNALVEYLSLPGEES